MYQEPTGLHWIGCLIWNPRFRLGTSTPNINSQTKLTKGNFTRDEWNNLLHLFNISHFRSTCCAENSSLISCHKTMAKRMQEQKGEEVWQNRNLQRRTCLLMFRQVPSPWTLIATGKPVSRIRRNSKSDAASSSQARLKDAYLGGLKDRVAGKLAATHNFRNHGSFLNLNLGAITKKK